MPQVKQLKELKVAGPATKAHHLDFFVQWHLTERCNLACSHCYQTDGHGGGELPLSGVAAILGEISDTLRYWAETFDIGFAPSISLTGGEPFLRADLFEILAEAKRLGFDIFLLTNGTLVNRDGALGLAREGLKGVQVSIEGPGEVHDRIRGRGSYSKAMSGITNLVDAGLPVTMNLTLSRLNSEGVFDLLRTAGEVGVQRFGFSRLVPSGRGLGLVKEMLSSREIKEFYERVLCLSVPKVEIVTGDPIASLLRDKGESAFGPCTACGGCAAGVSGFTLLPDGTVTPCRRLHIPVGNLTRDPLREIWAASPVLEALRDKSRYSGKCALCDRWAQCRGCRAIAYAWSAAQGEPDFLSEDPQCFKDLP